jgi:hypothetical protein
MLPREPAQKAGPLVAVRDHMASSGAAAVEQYRALPQNSTMTDAVLLP